LPSLSVAHIEDVAKSYTDTFGLVIPRVKSGLGQAKAGPEISYRHQFTPEVVLEPRAGLQLVANFDGETTAAGIGQISGEHADPVGTRGRVEIGLRMTIRGDFGLDLSGSYDGIGADDSRAFSGQVMVGVPLK
jgi:outer membrane autotransporter protein